VISDAMPPMVEMAVYNGSNLTITFNEAVMLNPTGTTTVVTLGGNAIGMSEDSKAVHNAKATDKNILVIPFTSDNVADMREVSRTSVFSLGEYDEAGLDSAAADAGDHATLDFSNVQDLFGNSWAKDSANLTAPTFAAYDSLGQIVGTPSPSVLTENTAFASSVTITYTFTHAMDINAMLGEGFGVIDENTNISGTQVSNIMTLSGVANIDTTLTSATINAAGTVLTVRLRTDVALSVGDSLDFNGNVPSLWTNENVDVAAVTVPTP